MNTRVAIFVLIGITLLVAVLAYRRWVATRTPLAAYDREVSRDVLRGRVSVTPPAAS